ncbi:Lrp/AsnC family transcriptional regulator [Plantactinospora sp. DSM 117369]
MITSIASCWRNCPETGRKTVRALAALVGLSEPAVRDRLDKLSREGVATGDRAVTEPQAVGAGTAAFVALRFRSEPGAKAAVNTALPKGSVCPGGPRGRRRRLLQPLNDWGLLWMAGCDLPLWTLGRYRPMPVV